MAEMNKMFVNSALAGLFVISFIAFIVTTQQNNDINDTILNNSIINKTYVNLNLNLNGTQSSIEEQNQNQDEDNPLTEGGSLLFISITKSGQVIKGIIVGVYNVLIVLPASLLGVPQIVIVVLTSILGVLLLLAAWRLYKIGE